MFMPHGQPETYGEMLPEVRVELNHRAAAFRLLCAALGCVPTP
jgi:inosine/xanthosine triphosphate pyrophosphatase family protein